MNNQRKLAKSSTDKWALGVLGGFAKYFKIDSNKLRIGFIIFSLLPGPSIIIYLACAVIMPSSPQQS